MKSFHRILTFLTLCLNSVALIAQQPDGLDPGNPRGSEGTINFWDDPSLYVMVIVIVVLLMFLLWLGKKNNARRKRRS